MSHALHAPHAPHGRAHAALGRAHAALGRAHPALGRAHPALGRAHAALGRAHLAVAARGHALAVALRGSRGQGTVEYVGLILLVSVILAGVVAAGFKGDAGIAKAITEKLKDSIDAVGGK